MTLDITNKRIAVLMGGPGSERKVSLKSGEGVLNALLSIGARAFAVDVTGPDFELPEDTEIAFNVIHGTFGEDGQVQRVLESRGVAYTGEGVTGSEIAIDKIATKNRLKARGVATAGYETIHGNEDPTMKPPLVIKAPKEGSSVGIFIVKTEDELPGALKEARKFGNELLVEQYITGKELTVGVVGDLALPVIEIRALKDFYNFENKYPFLSPGAAGADHFCPAPISSELTQLIQNTALSAHKALDLEVYSRVDFLLSESGEPFVLEINTIPGMTPSSLLPEAASVVGITYPELCRRIIELSLHRFSQP